MENEEGVIVNDSDAEDIGDAGIPIYDPAYTNIEISDVPFTIFEYLRQLNKGKIIIQPDFQRNQIWSNTQKSNFVESILLNYPLPPIYLNETIEGKYTVIDGLQRTSAVEQFYNNKFKLTNLIALPQYSGKYYNSLSENIQSKFEDRKLIVFVLKPSTPMPVIYDLFNRINRGGTQLNRQEVRNGIFAGKSTALLKELSELECFKKAIDEGVGSIRMKDREVVLRYLAFKWFDYQNEYAGDMSSYVESVMKRINNFGSLEIDEIKNDFIRVMNISLLIWGKSNFRIPTQHTRGTINIAVLESVCNFISSKSNEFFQLNREIVYNNYFSLLGNSTYIDSVTKSTGNKAKVIARFEIANYILNSGTI